MSAYYRRMPSPAAVQYGWPRSVAAATPPARSYRPGTVSTREADPYACCLPMADDADEPKRTAPYAGQSFKADLSDDCV